MINPYCKYVLYMYFTHFGEILENLSKSLLVLAHKKNLFCEWKCHFYMYLIFIYAYATGTSTNSVISLLGNL